MTENEQGKLINRSTSFIQCMKHYNKELYDYCTDNGNQMFYIGYRQLNDDINKLRVEVEEIYFQLQDSKKSLLRNLIPKELVKKYEYSSLESMYTTIRRTLFRIDDITRNHLKIKSVLQDIVDHHKGL